METMEIKQIELEAIRVSELNTRKDLESGQEDSSLEDLARSIQESGLLNPILVRHAEGGSYELIAGQRRLLAFKLLGRKTIPAFVNDSLSDADATVVSLVENVHRAEMHALDKAQAIEALRKRYGDALEKVAKATALSVSTVKRYLDLLKLPDSLRQKLSTKHGPIQIETLSRLVRTFENEEDQEEVYEEIAGFTQEVQVEILKRSGGDVKAISELGDQAHEGLFNVKMCRDGLCFMLPEEVKREIKLVLGKPNAEDSLRDFAHKLRKAVS